LTRHSRCPPAILDIQSVLEYAADDEPGADSEPWHDVHPAVQKLTRFRKALEKALEDERAQSPIRA
jgi:hypothetical protein